MGSQRRQALRRFQDQSAMILIADQVLEFETEQPGEQRMIGSAHFDQAVVLEHLSPVVVGHEEDLAVLDHQCAQPPGDSRAGFRPDRMPIETVQLRQRGG